MAVTIATTNNLLVNIYLRCPWDAYYILYETEFIRGLHHSTGVGNSDNNNKISNKCRNTLNAYQTFRLENYFKLRRETEEGERKCYRKIIQNAFHLCMDCVQCARLIDWQCNGRFFFCIWKRNKNGNNEVEENYACRRHSLKLSEWTKVFSSFALKIHSISKA